MEYGLVLLWLAAFFALGAVGLPIAAALLRRFPDRGAGVSLPLSLVVVTVVVLWVGRLSFGWPALAAGLAVLGAVAAAAMRLADDDPNWPIVGETAAVFAVAFLFAVAIRAVDPAVHPLLGEKFLDFGLLRSLLRSEALPPEDVWFAGESVAYYYGGHLIASLLATLTGTAADFAYNLALAGFYAMVVTAAFGVGGALAVARGASRRTGGLLAAFFVGFASNLYTAGQLLLWALPDAIAVPVAEYAAGTSEGAEALLAGPGGFTYWSASRVVDGTINEFPLFGWLNGDLHAHMMVTPFLLLVVALLAAYFRTPEDEVGRRRFLLFGAVPVVGGLIAVVDTWTFPTVFGLAALALLFAPADPATLLGGQAAEAFRSDGEKSWAMTEVARTLIAGGLAAGVLGLAAAWALPFLLGPASTRDVAFLPDRSGLGELLLVHGAFVAVFVAFLLSRARVDDPDRWKEVGVVVAGVLAISAVLDAAVVGLFAPLVVGGWVLLRRRADGPGETTPATGSATAANGGTDDAPLGFETVLLIGGAGLVLIVEFAYVDELAGPERMNTVFKTYSQVWVLWATAAGAMAATLLAESVRTAGARLAGVGPDRATVARIAVAVLVVSTSLYGALALPNHFQGEGYYSPYPTVDDPTLNATEFVEEGHPGEAAAIRWIDDLEGQPTIVTAAPGSYYWMPVDGEGASAPASLTGVPTVLGWHHEIGYRGWEPYQQRLEHVDLIYTGTPAEQAELLAAYDVAYVYVGPAERAKYGQVGFDGIAGVGEPREFGHVQIYPVDPENVSAGSAT